MVRAFVDYEQFKKLERFAVRMMEEVCDNRACRECPLYLMGCNECCETGFEEFIENVVIADE